MHEELYLKSKDPLRFLLLACGIVLLPAALFEWTAVNGAFSFSFRFDLPIFAACLSFWALCLLPFDEKLILLLIPYGSVALFCFLRFGTVSLFGRVLSFPHTVCSMLWLFSAFAAVFFLYFIAGGKIRSRLPLLILPSLQIVLAVCSLAFAFPPFRALENVTQGSAVLSISNGAAYILFSITELLIGLFLRDDKVREEAKRRREEKKSDPGR